MQVTNQPEAAADNLKPQCAVTKTTMQKGKRRPKYDMGRQTLALSVTVAVYRMVKIGIFETALNECTTGNQRRKSCPVKIQQY